MCDLTENGWAEHKRVIYHKIDTNNEYLVKLEAKQDAILEKLGESGRFEARTGERLDRVEKFVYGAVTVSISAVISALISLVITLVSGGGP